MLHDFLRGPIRRHPIAASGWTTISGLSTRASGRTTSASICGQAGSSPPQKRSAHCRGEIPACPSETILLQKPSFPMVSGLCAGETPALQRAEIHCGAVGTPADHSPASSLRRISSAIVSNSGSPRSESRSVSVSNPPHDQPVSRASWRLANASLRWPSMALMQARL